MDPLTDKPKFPIGSVLFSENAVNAISTDDFDKALGRHERGDWGEVEEETRCANNDAMKRCGYGEFVLSQYRTSYGQAYLIYTSGDRVETFVVLADESYLFHMPEVVDLPWPDRPMFFDGDNRPERTE